MADEKVTLVGQVSLLATRMGTVCHDLKGSGDAVAADLAAYKLEVAQAITDAKAAVKNDILNGAGEAYDTLKELGELIDSNKGGIEALEALAAGHVHFDKAQELTADQKKQARDNIGALAAADLSEIEAGIAANKAATEANASAIEANETAISTNATAIETLRGDMGSHEVDFVALFNAEYTKVDAPAA